MSTNTLYHKSLRVLSLAVSLLLLFQFVDTRDTHSGMYFGARMLVANVVSMTASVTPNEFNVITAELTKRSTELDAREAQIREREIDAQAPSTARSFVFSEYMLSALLFLLLILITMNYVFDFLRARKVTQYASVS